MVAFCGWPAHPPIPFPSHTGSSSGQSNRHPLTFSSSSLWVKLSWTLKTIFWPTAEIRKVVFKIGYDPRSRCTTTTTATAVEAGQQNHIQLQIFWPKTLKQENLAIPNLFHLHYYTILGEKWAVWTGRLNSSLCFPLINQPYYHCLHFNSCRNQLNIYKKKWISSKILQQIEAI